MEKLKLLFKISLPLISVLLTSCTLGRVPLNETQRASIKHSQQTLASRQKNIEIKDLDTYGGYSPSTGAFGAALAAMAISNENAHHPQYMRPITQQFQDGYFNQLMNQNLSYELSKVNWLHLNQYKFTKEARTGSELIKETNNFAQLGDTLIYVDFSYQLSPMALHKLQISADVSIYKKEPSKAVLIYQNNFKYLDALEKKKNQDYIALWAQNNGKRIKQAMTDGVNTLSRLIVKDIQNPSVLPDTKRPTNIWYENFTTVDNKGYFEKDEKDKTIIRDSFGGIIVLNSSLVRQKHNWRE